MTLPVIIASTREALAAVPRSFREACWNVGATKWQTIRAVVLPNAISGILTGVILQVSRTAGETAPILFTGAVLYKAVDKGDVLPYSLTESCMALATHLYNLATQINGAPESLQYATATVSARHGPARQRDRDHSARLPSSPQAMVTAMADSSVITVRDLRISYGHREVVHGISFDVKRGEIFGIIGPSHSGKTSLLKCLNRTLEFTPGARMTGHVVVEGEDVMRTRDVFGLRRQIGIVAPLPVGLPLSIYDNVAFAPRTAGVRSRAILDALVERCLRQAELWDEVKDRLDLLGTRLSGGQQQRLTIARALSHDPTILCLDEFSIAIDPVTTMKIEEMLKQLSQQHMTIILVTNLTQQARRLADRTMFLLNGEIVEIDRTVGRLFRASGQRQDVRVRQWNLWMSADTRSAVQRSRREG